MRFAFLALAVAGYYPLYRAWMANRRTTLCDTILWAIGAWTLWGVASFFEDPALSGFEPLRYLALCASGAAHAAVLGARRPGVTAWNFVVGGLLVVLLLPLGEGLVLGAASVTWPRILFLAGTLAVGVITYLPTWFFQSALLLGGFYAFEMLALFADDAAISSSLLTAARFVFFLLPWLVLAFPKHPVAKHGAPGGEFDRLWFDFRDRFGAFWAQRMREQYNIAARQAGYAGQLAWRGWMPDAATQVEIPSSDMTALLQALLTRFKKE